MTTQLNYTPVDLKVKTVKLKPEVKRFTDIPFLNPIPTNIIIDKVIPGLGATYSELMADRNSILILPNVSTIKGKHDKHKDSEYPTFAVYEDVNKKDLKHYLQNCSTYKKILTTPEGFIHKVKPALGKSMYTDYFLLLDECHKITTDSGYRADIVLPMDDFFMFTNKAMVSSTVLLPSDTRFKKNDFKICKIKPQFNITIPLVVEETNNVQEHLIRKLISSKKRCFVFFNSLHGIRSVVDKLRTLLPTDELDYKVFCSKNGAEELRLAGYLNAQDHFDRSAKFNFLTSSFFNGLDIDFEGYEANVYMITDIDYAPQSAMNVETDVVQIRGRFRKYENGDETIDWVKHFVHIVKTDSDAICLTREEAIEKIEISKGVYQYLQAFPGFGSNSLVTDVIKQVLKLIHPYSGLINADLTLNPFKVDNYILKEYVISLYKDLKHLLATYEDTKRYQISYEKTKYKLSSADRLKYHDGKYSVEAYIDVTNILWQCDGEPNADWALDNRRHLEQRYSLIVRAYDILQIDILSQLGFEHKLAMRCLTYAESLLALNSFPVINAVYNTFNIGQKYLRPDLKSELQTIYDEYEVSKTADASDILLFYDVKEIQVTINKQRQRAYKLLRKVKGDIYDRN